MQVPLTVSVARSGKVGLFHPSLASVTHLGISTSSSTCQLKKGWGEGKKESGEKLVQLPIFLRWEEGIFGYSSRGKGSTGELKERDAV